MLHFANSRYMYHCFEEPFFLRLNFFLDYLAKFLALSESSTLILICCAGYDK